MCRKGTAVDALQPNTPKSSRTRRASKSSANSPPSLSLSDSSSAFFSNNLNYAAADGSSISASSRSWSSTRKPKLLPSPSNLRKNFLPDTPHIYDPSEISAATGNFLSGRLFSSSAAWRCRLRDRDAVVFQRKLRHVIDTPSLCRVLSTICSSHHSSVIKLLGASVSGNHIYLAYDFVRGDNLRNCLQNQRNPGFTPLPTWVSRMQVAADIAHGLDYIHNFTEMSKLSGQKKLFTGFVHNRIKSSSIVVAEGSLSAKICHFGTAELCGEVELGAFDESQEQVGGPGSGPVLRRSTSSAMKFEGTRGYMSPEFRASGLATQKSDVYAFGVVILEILSGEEPLKFVVEKMSDGDGVSGGSLRSVSLIETAREAVAGGSSGVRRWVDRRLKDSFPVEVAEQMVQLGLECVEEDLLRRPDMARVASWVSKLYLESKGWAERFALPTDLSVSMAPR